MKKRRRHHQSKTILTSTLSLSHICIVIGVIMILAWGIHKAIYMRSLRLSEGLLATFTHSQADTRLYPTHVSIESAIDLPIAAAGYIDGQWLVSETKANHVSKSAVPGEAGNIILYAHNTATLFGGLLRLRGGELVHIRTAEGQTHTYRIVRTYEVDPTETQLLAPTNTEILTLYTCSGFLDSKRFVVRAVPERQ
jgi:LPXTG-site transpeptidase (sortase) family protein